MNLKYVRVGDTVRRQIADRPVMKLEVTRITDSVIECGPFVFDRATGAEIDEALHWGPAYGQTGSMIQFSAYFSAYGATLTGRWDSTVENRSNPPVTDLEVTAEIEAWIERQSVSDAMMKLLTTPSILERGVVLTKHGDNPAGDCGSGGAHQAGVPEGGPQGVRSGPASGARPSDGPK